MIVSKLLKSGLELVVSVRDRSERTKFRDSLTLQRKINCYTAQTTFPYTFLRDGKVRVPLAVLSDLALLAFLVEDVVLLLLVVVGRDESAGAEEGLVHLVLDVRAQGLARHRDRPPREPLQRVEDLRRDLAVARRPRGAAEVR